MAVTVWQIPDAVVTVVCASDDGWKYHPKHVEQFPHINKLCNVASCWIYIRIFLQCTYQWTLNAIVLVNCWWTATFKLTWRLQKIGETREETKLQFECTKWSYFLIEITSPTREHKRFPVFSNSNFHNSPRSVIWYKMCEPLHFRCWEL
jgi:hypothetical protein